MMKVFLCDFMPYSGKAQIIVFCVNGELLPDAGFFYKNIGEICIKMLFASSQIHISMVSTTANTLAGTASLLKLK